MSFQFTVLASGSRGNVSLVRAGHLGLLIDLGLGPRSLLARLAQVGSSIEQVGTALLTHTHGDHVQDATLRLLARNRVTLYCHEGHRQNIGHWRGFDELDEQKLIKHYDDRPFLTPQGLRVESVELSHDGGPTYGFRVEGRPVRGRRTCSVGYLADTGCWSGAMAEAMTDVDVLGVEFNHDVQLQLHSGRSWHLIHRNLGDRGHLSNDQAGEFVAEVLERSSLGTIRELVLLHLSDQCNRVALALAKARAVTKASGRKVLVHAASQDLAYPDIMVKPGRRARVKAEAPATLFPWEADHRG